MLCSRVQNLLSAYLDREMTGAEMLQIREHLTSCEACAQEQRALARVKSLYYSLEGARPAQSFSPEILRASSQPSLFRLVRRLFVAYQPEIRSALRSLQPARALSFLHAISVPAAVAGALAVGVAAGTLLRQPQSADAVTAHVPEAVASEYAGPALIDGSARPLLLTGMSGREIRRRHAGFGEAAPVVSLAGYGGSGTTGRATPLVLEMSAPYWGKIDSR